MSQLTGKSLDNSFNSLSTYLYHTRHVIHQSLVPYVSNVQLKWTSSHTSIKATSSTVVETPLKFQVPSELDSREPFGNNTELYIEIPSKLNGIACPWHEPPTTFIYTVNFISPHLRTLHFKSLPSYSIIPHRPFRYSPAAVAATRTFLQQNPTPHWKTRRICDTFWLQMDRLATLGCPNHSLDKIKTRAHVLFCDWQVELSGSQVLYKTKKNSQFSNYSKEKRL